VRDNISSEKRANKRQSSSVTPAADVSVPHARRAWLRHKNGQRCPTTSDVPTRCRQRRRPGAAPSTVFARHSPRSRLSLAARWSSTLLSAPRPLCRHATGDVRVQRPLHGPRGQMEQAVSCARGRRSAPSSTLLTKRSASVRDLLPPSSNARVLGCRGRENAIRTASAALMSPVADLRIMPATGRTTGLP
jgi:hypothetical protein